MLVLTLISAFTLAVAKTNPEFEAYKLARPQEFSGEFEGDILRTNTRNSVIGTFNWPNGVVPYDDSSMSGSSRSKIRAALDEIQTRVGACVRFVPRTNQISYIIVHGEGGCSSYIGVVNRSGPQGINLGFGCLSKDTIQHEFIHALGFEHEQSRSDRDKYLDIHWENIGPENNYNFNKENTNINLPYDYGSVMQYSKYAFSKNFKATMTAKKSGATLGGSLTNRDVLMIQKRYGCEQCIGVTCPNGICVPNKNGYGHSCRCKPGYAGNNCQARITCDCDYSSGGCVISDPPLRGYACKCIYKGAWTCGGEHTSCTNPGSAKCLYPDKSYATCLQGNGDCGGY